MSTLFVISLVVGIALGALLVALARRLGERRVFSLGLIVAAVIYVGFALYGDAERGWVSLELAGVLLYGALAVLGLRHTQCWLALGWGAHPVWDVGLHLVGGGSTFAPAWYAVLCIGLDLVVAVYIIFRCRRQSGADPSIEPNGRCRCGPDAEA